MSALQYLMAFLFLGCYSMALSQFSGARGRRWSAGLAATAAIGFIALTDPWEHGVLVIALALVAFGGFAVAVWALWALSGAPHVHHGAQLATEHVPLEEPNPAARSCDWLVPLLLAAWAALWRPAKQRLRLRQAPR